MGVLLGWNAGKMARVDFDMVVVNQVILVH